MSVTHTVTVTGLRELRDGWESLSVDLRNLQPVAPMIRRRWAESETRTLRARPAWEPRRPSTQRRYRYPIRGRVAAGPPGVFTGRMRRALTTPGDPLLLNSTHGNLTVTVGPRPGSELAYAGRFDVGGGGQPARRAIEMDHGALVDAADDVCTYLIGRYQRRR